MISKLKSLCNDQKSLWKKYTISRKALIVIFFTVLLGYLTLVITFSERKIDYLNASIISFFISFVFCSIALACIYMLKDKCKISITPHEEKTNLRKEYLIYTVVAFLLLLIPFFIAFPQTDLTPDILDQYKQVESFEFNDWHPVLHTLLLWLPMQIIPQNWFVVLCQNIALAFAVGYLSVSLEKNGFSKKLSWFCNLFCVLNLATGNIMQLVFKDCAFAICILFLTTCLINIYLTDGKWLKKTANDIIFIVLMVFSSLIRHNGIIFTGIAGILLLILYRKYWKRIVVVGLSVLTLIFVIKIPFYSLLGVNTTIGSDGGRRQTFVESIGVPMTILCGVYAENPDNLHGEAREFMDSLAPYDEFVEKHVPGNYNQVKWAFNISDAIVDKGYSIKDICIFALEAAKEHPGIAFNEVIILTRMVWSPICDISRYFQYSDLQSGNALLQSILLNIRNNIYSTIDKTPVFDDITDTFVSRIGFQIIAILVCAFVAIFRKGSKVLLLILPILAYNFGTMLLLCGNDWRFFYFNVLIYIPICFVLVSEYSKK